jgi:hypothetical protein
MLPPGPPGLRRIVFPPETDTFVANIRMEESRTSSLKPCC